jgi:hypothetical protein
MKGTQKKFTCQKCGKVFTAWRPDELPGAPVKCYFCGNQFQDEAAKRPPLVAPAPAAEPAAPAAPAASEAAAPETAESKAN